MFHSYLALSIFDRNCQNSETYLFDYSVIMNKCSNLLFSLLMLLLAKSAPPVNAYAAHAPAREGVIFACARRGLVFPHDN